VNLRILEQIASRTRLSIDYGGGLRSIPALRQVWDAGADMFAVGSVAVMAPDEFRAWVEKFGPDKFLVGADVRDRKVAVHGWQSQTEMDIMQLLERLQHLEIRHVSVTDIERDGEMNGPAFDLYRDIRKQFPNVNLVATGGISSVADLENLQALGCHGAVVGKAFFEGEIPLQYFKIHSKI
jgi:phosphoribosylformimino-5-aminoimidazole carboxamide ribotide isomerase